MPRPFDKACACVCLLFATVSAASAQIVPNTVSYQGTAAVANGNYTMTFRLWTAPSGGNLRWQETDSPVAVTNNTFTVVLGKNNPLTAPVVAGPVYISFQVGSSASSAPVSAFTSVPYALLAGTVPDGSLGGGKLANGAVTTAKIANGAVTSLNIAPAAIHGINLGTGAVGEPNIAAGAVTASKLGPGAVTSAALGLGAVGTWNIASAAVTTGDLAPGSVTSSVLANGAVTQGKIANYSITGAAIANGTITAVKLAPGVLGSGGAPSGAAGGDLAGTYPNPSVAANAVDHTNLANDPDDLTQVSGGVMAVSNGHVNIHNFFGVNSSDEFTYQNLGMGYNALGWFGDAWNPNGATSWLAGYAGIKLFTNGAPRLEISQAGNVGINVENPSYTFQVQGSTYLQGNTTISLQSSGGGAVYFANDVNDNKIYMEGLSADGTGAPAEMLVTGKSNTPLPQLTLKAINTTATGMITANSLQINGGSDLAEPYKIAATARVKPLPGMVVIIDPNKNGQMVVSSHAYDDAVGGIISGANGVQPGVMLRQAGTVADGSFPVASVGRVWCYCDAGAGGPIRRGDLLTTSNTPGHAMRAADYNKARGAILGKAMSSLKSGKGLVLVLVTLQ